MAHHFTSPHQLVGFLLLLQTAVILQKSFEYLVMIKPACLHNTADIYVSHAFPSISLPVSENAESSRENSRENLAAEDSNEETQELIIVDPDATVMHLIVL